MYLFVGWVDKTANLINNSISISDELQERVNSADFQVAWYKPNDLDDVKIYEGFPIYSYTSSSITLKKKYAEAILNNIFRVGDVVDINIPNNTLATITSISSDVKNYISWLVAYYDGSGVDLTWNWNTGTASGNLSYWSDQYGNYTYFQGNRNYAAWPTGTEANLTIGNRMNFTQATDYSWSVTVSVLWATPNNGSGIFWSWFDNSIYITGTTGNMQVSLRWSTNVFIAAIWWSNYWNTRYGQIHTIGFTYIASEAKAYVYLDGVLQNAGWTAWPATFLCNEWRIGDGAIGWGNGSSCDKKIYQAKIFSRALEAADHLRLYQEGTWLINSNEWRVKLAFSSNFSTLPTVGALAWKKKFAWNIIDIQDSNNVVLTNVQFNIKALDYTRIFDKKLLNDTYEDVDVRYIVNDFCNVTINPNQELDPFTYADNTAIQSAWIESWDWTNPTWDTTNLRETTWSGVFWWTFASGTATFTKTITSIDISSFMWVSSGTPTKGCIGFWYKCADYTKVTSFKYRVGSDSSNYIESPAIDPTSNSWTFYDFLASTATKVGTPVWTACDYIAVIITETASSSINFDGMRILETEFFRHYPYVEESPLLDNFRMNRIKPTEVMQRLANSFAWYWFVDYDRYIHLFPETTNNAPISLTATSNNFANLSIEADTSRLINRQVVRASDETSSSTYSQVIEGNGIIREWIMKNTFKNLVVKLNDWSSTDTMEATTTSTTVKATAHGLVVGDYIVNRTRSNAVREVLTVPDANTFTVSAVTSQTSWDTFSLFVSQTVGIEGIDVETSYDYMSNYTEKSIRASSSEPTIIAGYFLLFSYNEVIPILVQRTDSVSIALMKSTLGYSDGIFDGQPIIDKTIKTRAEAWKLAQAQVTKYSNVVITARFTTEQEWLKAWQLISITDNSSSQRNINQTFVIQSVKMRQLAWWENKYTVTCSSLLFGMVELLQQLLAIGRKIEVDENEVINNIETADETVAITDSTQTNDNQNLLTETLTISDVAVSSEVVPPFLWAPTGTANEFRWELSVWN